jgi:hypothetical protein
MSSPFSRATTQANLLASPQTKANEVTLSASTVNTLSRASLLARVAQASASLIYALTFSLTAAASSAEAVAACTALARAASHARISYVSGQMLSKSKGRGLSGNPEGVKETQANLFF